MEEALEELRPTPPSINARRNDWWTLALLLPLLNCPKLRFLPPLVGLLRMIAVSKADDSSKVSLGASDVAFVALAVFGLGDCEDDAEEEAELSSSVTIEGTSSSSNLTCFSS